MNPKKASFIKLIFSLLAVLFSFSILALSILRVSVWSIEENIQISKENSSQDSTKAATAASSSRDDLGTPNLIATNEAKVDYYLPYPGILPDHPLYFLKMIRDRIWLFFTTDSLKKAEIFLLFADKRINAAQFLVNGNKASLGVSTALKAEKYLERSINQIESVKDNQEKAKVFKEKLALSGGKHEEILSEIQKVIGDNQTLDLTLNLNQANLKKIQNLQ